MTAAQPWKRLLPAGRPTLQPTLKPNAPEGSPNTPILPLTSVSCSRREPSLLLLLLVLQTCSESGGRKAPRCLSELATGGHHAGFSAQLAASQRSTTWRRHKRPFSALLFLHERLWLGLCVAVALLPVCWFISQKEGVRMQGGLSESQKKQQQLNRLCRLKLVWSFYWSSINNHFSPSEFSQFTARGCRQVTPGRLDLKVELCLWDQSMAAVECLDTKRLSMTSWPRRRLRFSPPPGEDKKSLWGRVSLRRRSCCSLCRLHPIRARSAATLSDNEEFKDYSWTRRKSLHQAGEIK